MTSRTLPQGQSVMETRYKKISEENQKQIETSTIGQAENPVWMKQRLGRLTASFFGEVIRRKNTTPCAALVKRILYPTKINAPSVRWGSEHEPTARKEYMTKTGNFVRECGLYVDESHPWLAASPDGVIFCPRDNTQGLLEIKCPYTAGATLKISPVEAATHKDCKGFCSALQGNELRLKESHKFYYQVQGQLHITKFQWCDFVIWTPSGMYIERIRRDDDFWTDSMFPKLKYFFFNCLLPGIASPRHPRNMAIREPQGVSLKRKRAVKGKCEKRRKV